MGRRVRQLRKPFHRKPAHDLLRAWRLGRAGSNRAGHDRGSGDPRTAQQHGSALRAPSDRVHARHLRPPRLLRRRSADALSRGRLVRGRLRDRSPGRGADLRHNQPARHLRAGHRHRCDQRRCGGLRPPDHQGARDVRGADLRRAVGRSLHRARAAAPLVRRTDSARRGLSGSLRARVHDVLRAGRVVVPVRQRLLALPAAIELGALRDRMACDRRRAADDHARRVRRAAAHHRRSARLDPGPARRDQRARAGVGRDPILPLRRGRRDLGQLPRRLHRGTGRACDGHSRAAVAERTRVRHPRRRAGRLRSAGE